MGLLLYLLAALIELGSAYLRYRFGVWLGGPIFGAILGFGPHVWSLASLVGLNSGVIPSYFEVGARQPSQREREMVTPQLESLIGEGVRGPRQWYVVDQPDINAFVIGRILFLTRDVIRSPHLRPILAHELGHLNSFDGRLMLALRCLVFPGAMFVYRFIVEWARNIVLLVGCLFFLPMLIVAPLWIAFALLLGGWSVLILMVPLRLYWRQREYVADKYAARLGEARPLAEALDTVHLPLDMATPWMFITDRSHPYTELRVDRLLRYTEAQDEAELRNMPVATRLDWAALGGSSLVFGFIGLLVAMCGLLPLLFDATSNRAQAARERAVSGVNERVDSAVNSVGNAIAGAVADQVSRAFFGESGGNSGAVTGGSESTAAPPAAPAGAPLNVTRVDGRGVSCDSLYAVQTKPVTVYSDPAPGTKVLADVQAGSYLMLDCVTGAPPGWVAARAGGDGLSDQNRGWVEESAVNENLAEVPPQGVTPAPVELYGLACDTTYRVETGSGYGLSLYSVPNIHKDFGIGEVPNDSYVTTSCAKPFADWVYVRLADGSAEGWHNLSFSGTKLRPMETAPTATPSSNEAEAPTPTASAVASLTPTSIPAGAGLECNASYVVTLPEADASLPLLERPDVDASTVEVVLTGGTVSVDCRADPQAGWISVVTGLGAYGWIPETASQYLMPVGPDTGAAPNQWSQG